MASPKPGSQDSVQQSWKSLFQLGLTDSLRAGKPLTCTGPFGPEIQVLR